MTITRRTSVLAVAALLALTATACRDEDLDLATNDAAPVAAETPTTVATNQVGFKAFAFTGIDAARAFTTWTIKNEDTAPHTVTAEDNSFSWRVEAGATATFNQTLTPGRYAVFCQVHPSRMRGTLVVT